ncbi:hypothetical protein HPB50_013391 [Hyalomma asiaticum]|uniref:Uncharacterized protein n=1 Tax=Hyalomma asiaticum TaxID=266040 RepID=A0ACB7RIG8_HYAAI|nr:hypothetical protein HPB50_013391 [Hyalomma asiaticum]
MPVGILNVYVQTTAGTKFPSGIPVIEDLLADMILRTDFLLADDIKITFDCGSVQLWPVTSETSAIPLPMPRVHPLLWHYKVHASVVTLIERTLPEPAATPTRGGSIQQRLKSHILKAVADNSAMDHKMAGVNSAREQDQTLGDMLRGVRVITKRLQPIRGRRAFSEARRRYK